MKRVAAADFEQVFDIDTLREPAALAAMQTFYQTHGVVCISLERKIDVREVVGEMLESLMGDLPYSDEYMLSLRSASGRELHIKNRDDREDMITELLRSPISPVNLKRLELAVPLIASSGSVHGAVVPRCVGEQAAPGPRHLRGRCRAARLHGHQLRLEQIDSSDSGTGAAQNAALGLRPEGADV